MLLNQYCEFQITFGFECLSSKALDLVWLKRLHLSCRGKINSLGFLFQIVRSILHNYTIQLFVNS